MAAVQRCKDGGARGRSARPTASRFRGLVCTPRSAMTSVVRGQTMSMARPTIRRRGTGWCDRFVAALADPDALLRSAAARVLKCEAGGRAVALVTVEEIG